MRRTVPILLVLLFIGCASPPPFDRATATEDIREAVLRHQMRHDPSGGACYLSVGDPGGDPSDEFMRRFAHQSPAVKKLSQCIVKNLLEGVVDLETGKSGTIVKVKSVRWVGGMQAEVAGERYWNGKAAVWYTYTVEWRRGKWRIVKEQLDGVS